MNKVEGEEDEDEEAEHGDADGGDGDQAAGAEGLLQGLRQLGDAVTHAAVGELALPVHIARPHPEIQAPIHICNLQFTIYTIHTCNLPYSIISDFHYLWTTQ